MLALLAQMLALVRKMLALLAQMLALGREMLALLAQMLAQLLSKAIPSQFCPSLTKI